MGTFSILRRQCTQEYKINPVIKAVRKLYGLKRKQRTPATEIWLGISMEEMEKLKTSSGWEKKVYPLIDLKFSRSHCMQWLRERSFPIPGKSYCFFCPLQSDAKWREMKQERREDWSKAILIDEAIRNGTKNGSSSPIYLHRSCKPLKEVYLKEDQLELFNCECSGLCGV